MTHSNLYELLEKAIRIAVNAHFGQTDKAGYPYILHPLRVMNACRSTDQKIVAVLHDTLEDTSITSSSLLEEGFPEYIVNAISLLTKREAEPYNIFIERILSCPLAVSVKIEDIKDNMDTSRLPELGDDDLKRLNKYAEALETLRNASV